MRNLATWKQDLTRQPAERSADFQEFGPRFLACHVIFGVSCSKCCVSWRVNIYRVNKFRVVLCQNSACAHVRAMPCPPWHYQQRGFPRGSISSLGALGGAWIWI